LLRYTTDRPGLVAFYDIRPGIGAGLFLQPRNPHGAVTRWSETTNIWILHHYLSLQCTVQLLWSSAGSVCAGRRDNSGIL